MAKMKSSIKYFIGRSYMRDGFIRVSIYPKRPEVTRKVSEALRAAGYTESDEQTWKRLRARAHKNLTGVRM